MKRTLESGRLTGWNVFWYVNGNANHLVRHHKEEVKADGDIQALCNVNKGGVGGKQSTLDAFTDAMKWRPVSSAMLVKLVMMIIKVHSFGFTPTSLCAALSLCS